MAEQVIEGTWEQVAERYDLRGRRVRVILTDDAGPAPVAAEQWLREWAASHGGAVQVADDSRELIYEGTVEDPR